jgi:hypothetical protein
MNLKNRETPPELPAEEFKTERRQERIEDGIWIPGIFDEYKNEVAVAASTKLIKRNEGQALRILGDQKRFNRPLAEKIPAGRILAQLRDVIDPSIDLHHVVKAQLASGGNVKKIDEDFVKDLEKGNLENKQILKTDSLITNLKGYPLYTSAADCFPVGIYDRENQAIGLLHCGTYGLSAGVIENTLQSMAKEYNTDITKIKAAIAPGISDQYVITKTQLSKYQEDHPDFDLSEYTEMVENPLEAKFDLGRAIKDALIRNGVLEENIELSKYKTDKNNDLFPSDRKEGREKRDNYGFMIALK